MGFPVHQRDSNAGVPTLLYAIAAVVVGGASMFGGEGTIIGTVIGSLIIGTIQYGLVIVGVSSFWQYLAVGVIVVIAVIVDSLAAPWKGKRKVNMEPICAQKTSRSDLAAWSPSTTPAWSSMPARLSAWSATTALANLLLLR